MTYGVIYDMIICHDMTYQGHMIGVHMKSYDKLTRVTYGLEIIRDIQRIAPLRIQQDEGSLELLIRDLSSFL